MANDRETKTKDLTGPSTLSWEDRRKGRRFTLPIGWGALHETGHSSHVVAVVDISLSGAYLATRIASTRGQVLTLKLVFVSGSTLVLPCEVVRDCTARIQENAPPRGI